MQNSDMQNSDCVLLVDQYQFAVVQATLTGKFAEKASREHLLAEAEDRVADGYFALLNPQGGEHKPLHNDEWL